MADTTDAFDELFTDPFQTEWLLNDPWQGAYDGEDERTSGTSHAHSLDIGMPPIEEVVTPTALNRSHSGMESSWLTSVSELLRLADPPPKLSRLNTADNPYQRLGIRWQPIRALSVGGQSESPAMSYIDGDGSLSPEEGVRSPTTSTSEVDGGRPNERSEVCLLHKAHCSCILTHLIASKGTESQSAT